MPGAGDNFSLKRTLAQRPSSVQARVAQGVKAAADVGQPHGGGTKLYRPNRARCYFRSLSCAHKRHSRSSCCQVTAKCGSETGTSIGETRQERNSGSGNDPAAGAAILGSADVQIAAL